ncbi:MAG: hypothetical protein DWQ37_21380 [Planctomycetota bacterium]|mgnify:CR=1 FL=1|nr:MAG: hypothetical protein DWQ37_21380 [Planctomycetota bacterium]
MRDRILEAGGVQVRFFWQHDRYAHQVLLRRGGTWVVALATREGSSQDEWPVSPPFQSLEVSDRAPTQALLVGMAGKSHWSASVEIEPDGSCITFDVACRLRAAAGPLGSSYEVGNAQPFHVESTATVTRDEAALHIRPAPAEDALPTTVRWQYRLRPVD